MKDNATFRDAEMEIDRAVRERRISLEEAEELRKRIKEIEDKSGNRTKQGLPAEPYESSAVYGYREASKKVLTREKLIKVLKEARMKARRMGYGDKPSLIDGILEEMENEKCCEKSRDMDTRPKDKYGRALKQCTCHCKENELSLFILKEVERGASTLEIINKGAEEGHDALTISRRILELLREGHIYEPKKGKLRLVG